jgi:hypothetical protein
MIEATRELKSSAKLSIRSQSRKASLSMRSKALGKRLIMRDYVESEARLCLYSSYLTITVGLHSGLLGR